MKQLLSLVFILYFYHSKAQQFIWSPDSLSQADPNYGMDRYHDILRYHDPVMYLAFPVIKPIGERKLPLVDGEGKSGYLAEGNFAYRFIIYKGKYYTYPLFQRMRLTFDVSLTPRLTNDNSAPLLPSNNKFGFGLDFLLSNLQQLKKENAGLVWTTFQVHHYSNGQADSFYIPGPVSRNNYRNGDFSTNYFRAMVNAGKSAQQKSIFTGAVGYQKEIDIGGPLVKNKELKNYYGDQRLLMQLQWTQKPKLLSVHSQNYATPEADTIELQKRRQFSIRTELEYILGNLSNYPGEQKKRVGWHMYFTVMPSVANEVGFLLHTFIGRDYLNIRFDDIVFIGALGVYVKFNAR